MPSQSPRPARPGDGTREPMPARTRTLPLALDYAPAQFERIRLGLIPDAMEDKWFLYFEGDTLHMHRSWTGYENYRVRFERLTDGGARACEVIVNDQRGQYTALEDEDEAARVEFLINVLLAHNGWVPELPPTTEAQESELTLRLWSDIGRALLGQGPRPGVSEEAGLSTLH